MIDKIKKTMRKHGVQRSAALRIHANKSDSTNIINNYFSESDSAKKKPAKKRKRKRKMWIRRDIRRPGMFRRLMDNWGWVSKGESIPLWIKEQGCEKPAKTYKKLTGKKLRKTRLFQKQACLARTFYKFPAAHRGPGRFFYPNYDAEIKLPSRRGTLRKPKARGRMPYPAASSLVLKVLVGTGLERKYAKLLVDSHEDCIQGIFYRNNGPQEALPKAVKHVLRGKGRMNNSTTNKCCI